ncbi:DUF167 domain-containing protein [Pannus brasiliensis CCIBt3594]|uniref:UPF0235 protein V0288_09780 n=1 Tax=Pannus brasiliensis CCIBt3594 TaxID=1427578 RepID=A0AAW9QTS6_9CHRO
MSATIQVKVKPNAKQQSVTIQEDGSFLVSLKSPPTEGKANRELIEVLAKHFQVPRSRVSIRSGLSSRIKIVVIEE